MANRRRKKQISKRTTRLCVGDRVRLKMGAGEIAAVVVEDRGNIGVGGRQLVRVEAKMDPPHVVSFEVPAEEIDRVSSAA